MNEKEKGTKPRDCENENEEREIYREGERCCLVCVCNGKGRNGLSERVLAGSG